MEVVQQWMTNAQNAVDVGSERRGGSQVGKRPNIDRQAHDGAQRLFADYFSEAPVYTDKHFRRRFRMNRSLFVTVATAVEEKNEYFVQKPDATAFDIARLLRIGEERGFPGMLGSVDCCHWEWKNCPTAWAGQYKGKEKKPTIILEIVASYDLWIWHAFFGMPGSNNDINVMERSPIFGSLYSNRLPPVEFVVNGRSYHTGYYLADGIYPALATLVQSIASPVGQKKKHSAAMQESTRKDVERAFGVLMSQFGIIYNPARLWNKEDLASIIRTCIILHNMVIEDERDHLFERHENENSIVPERSEAVYAEFLTRFEYVHNFNIHYQLQNDLIEHLWSKKGEEQ
ncbi:uncharacterized protein LOC129766197 [Toxorhynchites rutilus septentrionalis]|uniref:uncharacterized protein LOC129766197 n=1 Tax=Toxorhynchites rutilus septentrionalis TaxID=329112 RepID=UPI002478EFBD|nr:uncharacterized protein LOC129766197 [Toxorhynchites rutilus septentrionalis]